MPRTNPERMSHKQERAIVALLNEPSLQKAAESIGVNARTIQKWMNEPQFVTAYRDARRAAFSQAIALTMRYAPLAVNTLAKIMMDNNSPVTAKVAAAVAVLKFGREGIELEDITERLAALERAAGTQSPKEQTWPQAKAA